MIKSISFDQSEILNWIIELYLGGRPFELDPTYSKGNFYKHGVPKPELKFDINPQTEDCMEADVRDLPLTDESVRSCIFDPPFIVKDVAKYPKSKMSMMKFGAFDSSSGRELFYFMALEEIYRILEVKGILAFKCQDDTFNHKYIPIHIQIYNVATSLGFRLEDLFILTAKSRPRSWNTVRQEHARKFHCYFWVFRKKR